MSEKLYIIGNESGAASSVKMVNQLLAGVHIAASAEAMALGARAGLPTRQLYDIISHAAGNSWMFENRVPHMLDNDYTPKSALAIFVKDLGIVLGEAKGLSFPTPLAAAAHQQFLAGTLAGLGREDDAAVVKVWEKLGNFTVSAPPASSGPEEGETDPNHAAVERAQKPPLLAFIGLGAMGSGMAANLVKEGFSVRGFDVTKAALEQFEKQGGSIAPSPAEAVKGAQVVVIMVTTAEQAEDVLFGQGAVTQALEQGTVVVLCSTVSPDFVRALDQRLHGVDKDVLLVDAPVSGGVARAAAGTLTIMAGGTATAFERSGAVLKAMSEKLYLIPGGVGAGSSVKTVNQLLAGVHVAASAEAMALGARAGLDTRQLYDIISHAAGNSWMFENRVPHMLDNDYTPHSALAIFVKDLAIVLGQSQALQMPLPLAAAAHQQFLYGAAAGLSREDDAAVVKVFERMAGISVSAAVATEDDQAGERGLKPLPKQATLDALPPEWPEDPTDEIASLERSGQADVLIVLDDDPTGTQTVHGVAVLTEWSVESLEAELERNAPCFFILTNSRALHTEEAVALTKTICSNVCAAAAAAGNKKFTIVLRGDSTLRGHFPQEAEAAAEVVGETDAWLLCPFFLQGGRYTINNVHYVADGDMLIPAGQTEFAKDAAFGYEASDLAKWVEEKTGGRITAGSVAAIPLDTIRKGGPEAVCNELCSLTKGAVCIINAASDGDMRVVAAGMIRAELRGKRFLCRTAASFVSARLGLKARPPLGPADLGVSRSSPNGRHGGLIVVGSYVPKTTKQVETLLAQRGDSLEQITVSVNALASGDLSAREAAISMAATRADAALREGRDTLVMTSRELVTGDSAASSLAIGARVSSALVEIVQRIQVRPRYILAKGGITSSDTATKALGAKRALVAGQALPGVPLWLLGPGSRHPGVPYIVFPGNVGGPDAVATVVANWAKIPAASTAGILQAAQAGSYAVGAFNVYNLEGAQAVVAAAEAEHSPAILQIHPSSLDHGGTPLVALCRAAADAAAVPVTVHLDHGSKESQLMNALPLGFDSIMVDGSHLPYEENVAFTRRLVEAARPRHLAVEAELGRLSGTEDGLTVEEYEAKLTDVEQAGDFLDATGVTALAVCVGNVHGKYPPSGPTIDLGRLKALQEVALQRGVVLVLHGASGLPADLVKECISIGVRKFNVNTEVRQAYMAALKVGGKDLLDVMKGAQAAMQQVVAEKMQMFGSSGKAL